MYSNIFLTDLHNIAVITVAIVAAMLLMEFMMNGGNDNGPDGFA